MAAVAAGKPSEPLGRGRGCQRRRRGSGITTGTAGVPLARLACGSLANTAACGSLANTAAPVPVGLFISPCHSESWAGCVTSVAGGLSGLAGVEALRCSSWRMVPVHGSPTTGTADGVRAYCILVAQRCVRTAVHERCRSGYDGAAGVE